MKICMTMRKETFSRNEGTKKHTERNMTCTTATLWLMGDLVMPASGLYMQATAKT